VSYFGEDEEYPGLARYQRASEELRNSQAQCAWAARLYVEDLNRPIQWVHLQDLKIFVERLARAEKELNDAEFCYRHLERAHERG